MAWLSNWKKRIKITTDKDKIDGDLSNFPVLLKVTSAGVFTELGADSKKIAVTTSNGVTQNYVEIENWNNGSNIAWLWTKVPTIVSGTDTDIYLYYDKTKEDNTDYVGDIGSAPGKNVWDDNFVGVWHMNQDPSGGSNCIKDSTSNTNHGTPGGSMTSGDLVDGKVGKALDFDGSNDEVDIGANLFSNSTGTVEVIVNVTSFAAVYRIFATGDVSTTNDWLKFDTRADSRFRFDINGSTVYNIMDTVSTFSTSTNYYLSWLSDGSSYLCYVNGSFESLSTMAGNNDGKWYSSLDAGTFTNWIGRWERSSSGGSFNGIIDEVRVSNIARSASWIKATYHSNWNTLLTYNSAQSYTPSPNYYYHGYVKEKGTYVGRKVYLYKRNTGTLVDNCMSNVNTGYYMLETSVSGEHFIVVLDDDAGDTYNALIEDRLYPNDK